MIAPHSATGNGLQRMNVAMKFVLNPGFACRSWAMDLNPLPPACATAGNVLDSGRGWRFACAWPEIRPSLAFLIDLLRSMTEHCDGDGIEHFERRQQTAIRGRCFCSR